MRATLTRLSGTCTAALDINGKPFGLINVDMDGDDIDVAESGRMIGSSWFDVDDLLAEKGVQRMVDGDYAQSWNEVIPGLWTVELTDI